jgi:hypothetical protein
LDADSELVPLISTNEANEGLARHDLSGRNVPNVEPERPSVVRRIFVPILRPFVLDCVPTSGITDREEARTIQESTVHLSIQRVNSEKQLLPVQPTQQTLGRKSFTATKKKKSGKLKGIPSTQQIGYAYP